MNKQMNRPLGLCTFYFKKLHQFRILFSLFSMLIFFNPFAGNASHIVGGEISYRCLGGSTFEVSLTVYRDCYLGGSNFDPIASIGIFDANNELVTSLNGLDSGQLLIPAGIEDTLQVILSDTCLFAPNNICVSSMTYVDTVILPPISGGYQLVYQRCCRSSSISNIVNSANIGASFIVDISESALLTCNSSPVFSVMPPLYLCVNEPFVFDQSVIDLDGDSLVYSLCTPVTGGTPLNPRPQPPLPPPYDEVSWLDPPYNLNNLLGGTPLLIDPLTGIVSGQPNAQGQFLVGLCIEEYRDGQLVSTSRREFQYNVGNCEETIASFEAPAIECNTLEINFINTSINATEYLWVFNDPGNPGATSTAINPTYTFSDTGSYSVMLIAEPNGACADTSYVDVLLAENTITPNFAYTILSCVDSIEIALVDLSSDIEYDIVSWFWELSDGQTSTEQIPLFSIDESQNLLITLTVKNSLGCQAEVIQFVQVSLIPSTLLEPEISICKGDTIQLNPMPNINLPLTYLWSPIEGLSDPNISSPYAFPESDVTYTLIITDTITGCTAALTTKILVTDNPELSINIATDPCEIETEIIASANTAGEFIWATDINFNNIISDSSSVTVSALGENTYYVQFIAQDICEAIDSIIITEQSIDLTIDPLQQTVCIGDIATYTAVNNDPNDILSYTWFNIDNISSFLSTDSILNYPATEAGEQIIYFQAENQFGCTFLDSVTLIVLDNNFELAIEVEESCNGTTVSFSNLSPSPELYQWVFTLPSENDTLFGENIIFEFPSVGDYTFSLEPIEGLPCVFPSEIYEITIGNGGVNAAFEWEYLECENNLSIQFFDLSTTNSGVINNWSWTFNNAPPSPIQNPILDLTSGQAVTVQLIVETDEGCSDTLIQEIEFLVTNIGTFENETLICDGNSVQLNPLGNPTLTYQWSPAQYLDDPNSVSPIASPPITTLFSVIITDPANPNCVIEKTVNVIVPENPVVANFDYEIILCESSSVTFSFTDSSTPATNINNWFWNFSTGETSNDQNTELVVDNGTELIVQLQVQTIEGCTDIITDTINVQTLEFNLPQNEIVKCNTDPVNLNSGGNPNFTYLWTPAATLDDATSANPSANPSETTEYCVMVSNGVCTIEECVTVVVPDEYVEANFSYEIINCDNSAVTFSFLDNSTPSSELTNWFWVFSTGETSNDQNTELEVDTGTELIVQFQVQTAEGCTDIISDTIDVETFDFELPQSEILKCTGVPVNLNPGGNPSYTYSWSPAAGLNNASSPNPIANPIETTEYCVTVTNGSCSQESCVTVVVPDVPLMADFSYNISDCIDEAVISFEDETQNSFGNIVSWNWTFSNGMTSDLENPILTVTESSTLEVQLEVVTSEGCEADITQEIEITLIEINIPSQVILCEGVPIQLNQDGNPNHTYNWSPSAGLTNTNISNPFTFPLATTTYTVVVSDGVCEIIQTVQVVVPEVPLEADFSYSIGDCTDEAEISFMDESQYEPGGIVDWNWQFSNGDSSNIANPILTLNESQTLGVTLEVVTNDGCIATTFQEFEVNIIDVNIPDTLINCNAIGVELNPGGDPTISYDWSPSSGLINPNSFNPTANPTTTTSYTVTISDGPCVIVRSVEVIVPEELLQPEFAFNFDDCTDNAIIEFTDNTYLSNNTITDWDWTFAGISTQTSDLQNPVITINQSDTILVELTVTTADGCTATTSQEIEVNLIDINISGSVIYCTNQGVTLNPDGNPAYEYNWSPAAGLSATDVASPTVTGLTQNMIYTVTVNFGNCTLTRTVEILIPDDPLNAAFSIDYLTCIDSSSIQFNDESTFSGSIIAWDWMVNSQNSNEQNPIFSFYENQAVDIQLVVTTAHGCKDTIQSNFDITVMDDVEIPQIIATCNSNGEFLNPDSNPNYSYQWTPGTGLAGDTLSANPFANPDSTTTYNVTISNIGIGCVEERMVTYTIPTEPLIAGFEWELLTCSDSATVEFTDTSSYSEILTNWDWTFDNGYSDTLQNPIFVFQNSDTIDVQLIVTSIDGCVDSIETTVEIDVINISELADTIQLCQEDSVYLNPNGNPDLFYTWTPSTSLDSANFYNPLAKPLASTKYFVTITSPNNITCNEVRTIDVLVPTQPVDLDWNYPTDTIICTPTLELVAQSSGAVEYLWSNQADFQIELGVDSNFIAFPNNSKTYYIQVSDDAGCTMTDSIEVTSNAILAELEEELTICYGDSVELEVLLNPLSSMIDLEYTWTPQDGIIMNPTTSTPLLSPLDTTEYILLIENQFGCEYNDTIDINVLDLEMLIDIVPLSDSIDIGETIQLSATESSDWEYYWTPSESLNFDKISNPIAEPEISTTYYVTIEDLENGCKYQDSIFIFVFDDTRCKEPYVFIPKGFTPNDDGLNDLLFVRGNYIEEMEFVIFNRWGEKVFETKDQSQGWDGKVDGKKVSPDVFGYYVKVKCFGGAEQIIKGNVTLIR